MQKPVTIVQMSVKDTTTTTVNAVLKLAVAVLIPVVKWRLLWPELLGWSRSILVGPLLFLLLA